MILYIFRQNVGYKSWSSELHTPTWTTAARQLGHKICRIFGTQNKHRTIELLKINSHFLLILILRKDGGQTLYPAWGLICASKKYLSPIPDSFLNNYQSGLYLLFILLTSEAHSAQLKLLTFTAGSIGLTFFAIQFRPVQANKKC